MAVLSPPFALGAAGQVASGRLLRLALGAAWRPAATGVQVVSGVLAGPPNTMGELTLAGTNLTVQAFRAIIQSALDATAGSYEVINDAPAVFGLTAQHASQFRRSLVVTRVDDSQVSGVASSAGTDRATLEVLDGPLAASQAATTLPAPAGSWLALGEVLIPPVGQQITVTPYNPRTGTRHGILPVIADGLATPGHDGALPLYDGAYRDHPAYGLQRGKGGKWWATPTVKPVALYHLRTTVGTINNGTWTPFGYDFVDYDPWGCMAAGTYIFTVPVTGVYALNGAMSFVPNPNGQRIIQWVKKPYTTQVWNATQQAVLGSAVSMQGIPGVNSSLISRALTTAAVGDQFVLYAWQNAGGNLGVAGTGATDTAPDQSCAASVELVQQMA